MKKSNAETKNIFSLKSENLTHLGGPMGSEYTTTNWVKYFKSTKKAKVYAEEDYKKSGGKEKIQWIKDGNGIRTQDLGFVMYHIKSIEISE